MNSIIEFQIYRAVPSQRLSSIPAFHLFQSRLQLIFEVTLFRDFVTETIHWQLWDQFCRFPRSLLKIDLRAGNLEMHRHSGLSSGTAEKSLKLFALPDSVEILSTECFRWCRALVKIHIHTTSSLKTIGDHAFMHCSSLSRLFLPKHVESVSADALVRSGVCPVGVLLFTIDLSQTFFALQNQTVFTLFCTFRYFLFVLRLILLFHVWPVLAGLLLWILVSGIRPATAQSFVRLAVRRYICSSQYIKATNMEEGILLRAKIRGKARLEVRRD
jgi:hypothetical protein